LLDELINYQIDSKIIAELDKAVNIDDNKKALEIIYSLINK